MRLTYANSQIIAQHDGDYSDLCYFYLHDRLGSVRQVIDVNAAVVNCYTYDPWGLAGCFGQILGDKIVSEFHTEYGVPGALVSMGGTAACVACVSPITMGVDKVITCGLCGGYLAYHGYSWYQIGNRITECVIDKCH